jgi:hypothetical protein
VSLTFTDFLLSSSSPASLPDSFNRRLAERVLRLRLPAESSASTTIRSSTRRPTCNISHGQRGPWLGFNWRYDGGLVAGPVPCAGGDCSNGANGTNTVVDVSGLSPDQQFQAGLFCGAVHAVAPNPANPLGVPISPNGLCSGAQYGSTLVSITAPGTNNADRNPSRIAPRHLFDVAVGEDNLLRGDKYKVSLQFTAINLTNRVALYNFLSTFSGTHYVTPRTLTAELGFHF